MSGNDCSSDRFAVKSIGSSSSNGEFSSLIKGFQHPNDGQPHPHSQYARSYDTLLQDKPVSGFIIGVNQEIHRLDYDIDSQRSIQPEGLIRNHAEHQRTIVHHHSMMKEIVGQKLDMSVFLTMMAILFCGIPLDSRRSIIDRTLAIILLS